ERPCRLAVVAAERESPSARGDGPGVHERDAAAGDARGSLREGPVVLERARPGEERGVLDGERSARLVEEQARRAERERIRSRPRGSAAVVERSLKVRAPADVQDRGGTGRGRSRP